MRRSPRLLPFVCVACFAAALLSVEICDAAGPGGRPGGGGVWQARMSQGGMRGHRGHGYGYGWGGNYDSWASLYRMGHIPIPPYFALHPPVYYSQPVARTYGYSPHAYPGWVPTPEIVEAEPQPIINPFVQPPAEKASTRTASAPKVTHNPFVRSSQAERVEQLARVVSP